MNLTDDLKCSWYLIWLVVWNMFWFYIYLEWSSHLTNMCQRGSYTTNQLSELRCTFFWGSLQSWFLSFRWWLSWFLMFNLDICRTSKIVQNRRLCPICLLCPILMSFVQNRRSVWNTFGYMSNIVQENPDSKILHGSQVRQKWHDEALHGYLRFRKSQCSIYCKNWNIPHDTWNTLKLRKCKIPCKCGV